MGIYLPTAAAGKVKIGADARIVLDARPDLAIPAKVAFIATQAQFTPKMVETKEERDKLMFRIRVKIDPERLRARGPAVRSGLPGVAYVKQESNGRVAARFARKRAAMIECRPSVARVEGITQRYGRRPRLTALGYHGDATIGPPPGEKMLCVLTGPHGGQGRRSASMDQHS
jgi:hypothetical protein